MDALANPLNAVTRSPGIPASSFANMVAFAMSQPEDVDINEILFRPTRQEL
jgi:NADP-dependent 3-hydroxy acid dehydrogenase YdfG